MTTLMDTQNGTEAGSVAELVGRAKELHPIIRKNAAEGEEQGRVHEETFLALRDAGLFRLLQPKRFGGLESNMRTLVDVSAAVGEADGGTAWAVSLLNSGSWLAGCFSDQAQEDVWGENPDAMISGVFSPRVQTKPALGGYRITGEWYYTSGSLHADWAVLSAPLMNGEGDVVDMALALVPSSDFTVKETWFVAGMSASGSNCIVVDDAFVPDHRFMSLPRALEGEFPNPHSEETLYTSPLGPLFTVGMVGPQLGLGRAALELVKAGSLGRPITHTIYANKADSVGYQIQLAQAAMMLDTAHFHAHRVTDDMDSAAARGEKLDFLARTRIRADIGWSIENVVKAIDLLLYANGAGAFAKSNPLQRIWRDSTVSSRHAGILPALCYEIYGKGLVGSQERITPVI